jgi:hypothetical protein
MGKRLTGLLLAAALLSGIGGETAHAQSACPSQPTVTRGDGASAFTMLIRINQQDNADTWINRDSAKGGLGGRVRVQDIFVINTRFDQTPPAVADQIARSLRAAFPCNRIIALNGLNLNPAFPGYIYSLASSPVGLWSVILDYEAMDWNEATFVNGGMPPWNYRFPKNIGRVRGWTSVLSSALAGSPNPGARAGLIPVDRGGWDYGVLGQKLDKSNRRIGRHAGVQVVQTQETCAAGRKFFGNELKRLHTQYRFHTAYKKKKVRRHGKLVTKRVAIKVRIKKKLRPNPRNLVTQISFSDTPSAGDPLPIRAVGPQTADRCTEIGMAHGQRAFFYFASDASMRLLFQQPLVGSLRPPLS